MTSREKELSSDEYKVGYGKPPVQTRFRKGTSGNAGRSAAWHDGRAGERPCSQRGLSSGHGPGGSEIAE